jgi:hypothetical protein
MQSTGSKAGQQPTALHNSQFPAKLSADCSAAPTENSDFTRNEERSAAFQAARKYNGKVHSKSGELP